MKAVILFAAIVGFCGCGQKELEKEGITFSMYPAVEGKEGDKSVRIF